MAAPFQPNKRQAGEDAAPSPKKRQRAARACIVCRRKRIKVRRLDLCAHLTRLIDDHSARERVRH